MSDDKDRIHNWKSDKEVHPWVAAFLLAFGMFGIFLIAVSAWELIVGVLSGRL
jgi:hypothetical protein